MNLRSLWIDATANIGLKLVSLVFALFLWFYVTAQIEGIETLHVPIEILNVPDSLVIASDIPRTAKISMKGPRSELLKARIFGNVRLIVDIGETKSRELTVPISKGMVSMPEGMKSEGVSIISPKILSISLERRMSKALPVKAVFGKTLPPDLAFLKQPAIAPESVVARGAEKIVSAFSEIKTPPIDIAPRRGRYSLELELTAPAQVEIEPKRVIVEMEISKRAERAIDGIIPTVVQSEEGYDAECSPPYADLIVSGPEELVRKVVPEDISIVLSIPAGSRGTIYVQPEVIVPSGIDSVRLSVDSFEVTIIPRS